MQFWKYAGCGNDFIIFNCLDRDISGRIIHHIPHLCHRKRGIGADGVIFALPQQMRIFNCDGKEAEMCGNGIRCLAHFLADRGKGTSWTIKTHAGPVDVEMINGLVGIHYALNPEINWVGINADKWLSCNTGVPHAVCPVPDIKAVDVQTIGTRVCHHPHFPAGTNVNFVQQLAPNKILLRTFERGVEAETEACGTGALAAGLFTVIVKKGKVPLDVIFLSGDTLRVSIDKQSDSLVAFRQWGKAKYLFYGEIELDGE